VTSGAVPTAMQSTCLAIARTIGLRAFECWDAIEAMNTSCYGQLTPVRPSGLLHFLDKNAQSSSAKRMSFSLCVVVEGCMQTPDCPEGHRHDSGLCGQTRERVWEGRLKRISLASSGSISITVDHCGPDALVRLNGRIDVDSSPDLRDCLLAILSEEPLHRAITVDLAGVPYIEASGIATLIEALKIARHRQMTFCLQGLGGSVLRLFEVTGVLALFEASNGRGKVS
jgi:anti-anti-sigma factor